MTLYGNKQNRIITNSSKLQLCNIYIFSDNFYGSLHYNLQKTKDPFFVLNGLPITPQPSKDLPQMKRG